jgi:hypothetical protein
VSVTILTCTRCGYQWPMRFDRRPATCANRKCKSPYWDKPRKITKGAVKK